MISKSEQTCALCDVVACPSPRALAVRALKPVRKTRVATTAEQSPAVVVAAPISQGRKHHAPQARRDPLLQRRAGMRVKLLDTHVPPSCWQQRRGRCPQGPHPPATITHTPASKRAAVVSRTRVQQEAPASHPATANGGGTVQLACHLEVW